MATQGEVVNFEHHPSVETKSTSPPSLLSDEASLYVKDVHSTTPLDQQTQARPGWARLEQSPPKLHSGGCPSAWLTPQ